MTFSQFLAILLARKWAAITVFVFVVVVTIAISLLLPPQYTGEASVVIDVKPDPLTSVLNPALISPSYMATQVDILTSDRVTSRVIRDLKLTDSPEVRRHWQEETNGQGPIEQWLIDQLNRKLDVKPSRDSNVITIGYKSPDPRFAAALANAYAQAFIATTLELRSEPAQRYAQFFNSQAKDALASLQQAQTRLASFEQQNGIVASDERFDVENTRLNELSSQLVSVQSLVADSNSRQSQAQRGVSDRMQEVIGNPLIANLKAELAKSEAALEQLSSRLGSANPQVIEARANVAQLRSRIDSETQRITASVGVGNRINMQREAELRQQLAEQRARVLKMKEVRDKAQVLQREIDNAQRTYDNVRLRLDQSGLESQTTQGYVNMLTAALPPATPSFPNMVLNVPLAIVMGLLLAIGVAMLLETVDRRLREPADVVALLGLPVLGVLPQPGAKRYVSGRLALPANPSFPGLAAPSAPRGA
jgi:chain length determinant protein EpsF